MKIGSIEAGGTKFICSVGNERLQIIDQVSIKTTTPQETLGKVLNYFKKQVGIESMGIASFGPLDLNRHSKHYGFITNTPKAGWQDVDILGFIERGLHLPTTITSDVNGSALGEAILLDRQHQHCDSLAYITIGTGIGAGFMVNDRLLGSLGHPEIGHIKVLRHPNDRKFKGICPFHNDCLEGLASGPTFKARLGVCGEQVPLNNPVWQYIAYYLAQAVAQITLIMRPDRIVFGGGVVNNHLLNLIRQDYQKLVNGYIPTDHLDKYLTLTTARGNNSATIGNLSLASTLASKIMYEEDASLIM